MTTKFFVKTSNCHPHQLSIDTDLERLYVSTTEGLILIFNINVKEGEKPHMIHWINPHLRRAKNEADFIR